MSPDALTIEATGTAEKLDALLRDLEPYGIKEMVQSGLVAIGRGSRSITTPALRAASSRQLAVTADQHTEARRERKTWPPRCSTTTTPTCR